MASDLTLLSGKARVTSAITAISVALTVKEKTLRKPDQGEVRWDVVVTNRDGETVAAYDLLTMNAA